MDVLSITRSILSKFLLERSCQLVNRSMSPRNDAGPEEEQQLRYRDALSTDTLVT